MEILGLMTAFLIKRGRTASMSTTRLNIEKQRGTVIVEFAMVGLLFFTLLLGVLEVGRLAYTWNTLAEASRLGARAAAVCGFDAIAIARVVRSNNQLLSDLTAKNIVVEYLAQDLSTVGVPDGAGFGNIRFAQVGFTDYRFVSVIPGLSLTFPAMTSTRPRESLGFVPLEGSNIC